MRLKQIRQVKHISVLELSRLSGMPSKIIREIESKNDCHVSTAIALSEALGVTLNEFCAEDPVKTYIIPERLYKYYPPSDYSIESLIDSYFYFSMPKDFNDPFDTMYSFNQDTYSDDILMKYVKQYESINSKTNVSDEFITQNRRRIIKYVNSLVSELNEEIRNMLKICCFSEANNNILMWSHYANHHQGFCIEFDSNKWSFNDLLRKVNYAYDYPKLSFEVEEAVAKLFELLTTKSILWSYEKEWRMLAKGVNQYLYYPIECVTKIFFGVKMTAENKEKIYKELISKNDNIEFYDCVLDKNFYKINHTPYQKN